MLGIILLCLQVPPLGTALHDPGTLSEAWSVTASAGAVAMAHPEPGHASGGIRLEYDFRTGGGFVVLRRDVALAIPENFRVTFDWRGAGRVNTIELKLVDGDNVWWNVQRQVQPPDDWTTRTARKRHFSFAWGPSQGAPLTKINAIEIAIVAEQGGAGHIVLDDLHFEPIRPLPPVTHAPRLRTSSVAGTPPPELLPENGSVTWQSAADDPRPEIEIDFQQEREYGGLLIEWAPDAAATEYEVFATENGTAWQRVATIERGDGGRDYLSLPDSVGCGLRIVAVVPDGAEAVGLRGLRLLPIAFGDNENNAWSTMAADLPAGHLPRYLLDKQTYWTVVGVPDDGEEALVDTYGAVEPRRGRYRIEPMLHSDGRLQTWADGTTDVSLAEGYLPIPSVAWRCDDWQLTTTVLADGPAGKSSLWVHYALRNESDRDRAATLYLVARPLQVLPPWQSLNLTGGAGRIERIAWRDNGLQIDGDVIRTSPPAGAFGATATRLQQLSAYLAADTLPASTEANSHDGNAAGALRYSLFVPAGQTREITLRMPLSVAAEPPAAESFADVLARVSAAWRAQLNRASIQLPAVGQRLVDTFRTTQAYILINADGPAIQPGSRTYERSWIRDGALTSTALLYSGHAERVRRYIDWFSPHQFDSGMVPCVVDQRGPDPVPEHDSTGEYIHLLWTYYRFTGDREPLAAQYERVGRGVAYLESLRAQRMTEPYRTGTPEQQACYGLVTESISHEGYSPARHSYWDSFFVVRGYRDAESIARLLGRDADATAMAERLAAYRASLYRSIERAMDNHGIEYIPGCVELGDFDATSTAIGVYPVGERAHMPAAALAATFDRYLAFFRDRRDGKIEWDAYTPYEIRIVATLVLLGRVDAAHELLDYFLADQRPAGWNHWAEVVHRDPDAPRFIGDMPHTWVGSGFINAFRCMLVLEREEDAALVLGAGLHAAWLDDPAGVRVAHLPTVYGEVSYTLRRDGQRVRFQSETERIAPPGGVRIVIPFAEIASVQPDGAATIVGPHEVHLANLPATLDLVLHP